MKSAQDSAANTQATLGVRSDAHRPRRAALLIVLAASLAALVPNAAQAHHFVSGANGVGGAQINITPDGYDEPYPGPTGRDYMVHGKGFPAAIPALIFQCPVTREFSLVEECQQLGVGQTNLVGNFAQQVRMLDSFISAQHGQTGCYGRYYTNAVGNQSVQCSVVAATYGPDLVITNMAEHYVCFEGMWIGPGLHDAKCDLAGNDLPPR